MEYILCGKEIANDNCTVFYGCHIAAIIDGNGAIVLVTSNIMTLLNFIAMYMVAITRVTYRPRRFEALR